MNFERLLGQIFRRLAGRMARRGLNRGLDHVARGGRRPADMSPEERAQLRQARQTAKRARQAARLMRRLR